MKNMLWFILVVVLLGVIAVLLWIVISKPSSSPAAPIQQQTTTTTTPPTPAQPVGTKQPLSAHVQVTAPSAGASVSSPFTIKGQAPGAWYFEAQFPLQVRDKDGNVIGRTAAHAQGDWMTAALVPFSASISIEGGYHGPATLILLKDNPSGLPENDDSVSFSIVIQ